MIDNFEISIKQEHFKICQSTKKENCKGYLTIQNEPNTRSIRFKKLNPTALELTQGISYYRTPREKECIEDFYYFP